MKGRALLQMWTKGTHLVHLSSTKPRHQTKNLICCCKYDTRRKGQVRGPTQSSRRIHHGGFSRCSAVKVALTEQSRTVSNAKNSVSSNKIMSTKETAKTTRMPIRPFTASWVLRHVRESPIETALMQLRMWAPNSQEKLDELLVKKIRNLPVNQALKAIHKLPYIHRIIKEENPLVFYVPTEIQTNDRDITITAQINSRCTKLVID